MNRFVVGFLVPRVWLSSRPFGVFGVIPSFPFLGFRLGRSAFVLCVGSHSVLVQVVLRVRLSSFLVGV